MKSARGSHYDLNDFNVIRALFFCHGNAWSNNKILIALHMVRTFGFHWDILKKILDKKLFIEKLLEEYPDKLLDVFENMARFNRISWIDKFNIVNDGNYLLENIGFKINYYLHKDDKFEKYVENKELDFYKYLIDNNFVPDQNTLEIYCKHIVGYGDDKLFDNLIKLPSIYPNNICAKNLVENYKYNKSSFIVDEINKYIDKILIHKIDVDDELLKIYMIPSFNNIFNKLMLFYTGNNKQILIKAIENKIIIENIENFGMKYDNELYYYCHKYDFFPDCYDKKFTIDKNILLLRNMCKTNKLDVIINFIKTHNLELDFYCADNSILNNDYKVMQHMIKNNYHFSFVALKMISKIKNIHKNTINVSNVINSVSDLIDDIPECENKYINYMAQESQ